MNRALPVTTVAVVKPSALACLCGLVASLVCTPATAQTAGQWLIGLGINETSPQVKSGDLSPPSLPGTRTDVRSARAPILTVVKMLTDNWSVEGFLGLPYKHEIVGAGAIQGVGRLGSVKQVSPTVLLQYRFLAPTDGFRPYLGIGPSYAHFFEERGSATLTALTRPGTVATRMKIDDALGLSMQVGANFKLNERWFLDASVIKTLLKTTTTLSTGQKLDARLDPVSTNFSVGYRF